MGLYSYRELSSGFGAEILGVDARKTPNCLERKELKSLWLRFGILLFRGQKVTPKEQVRFSQNFGVITQYTRNKFNNEHNPDILVLSNITKEGKLIGSPVSGRVWHTDGHYLAEPPAGSLLHAIIVPPEGGDTLFANMTAAWKDLPDKIKKRIQDKRVIISRVQSRPYNYPDRPPVTEQEKSEWEDISHPIVRVHPETGKYALYVGGNVPWKIEGMLLGESLPLITWLQEFSVMERYTYRHVWQSGDMILWDNRCVMHRATWYDGERYKRLMNRTTLLGDIPI